MHSIGYLAIVRARSLREVGGNGQVVLAGRLEDEAAVGDHAVVLEVAGAPPEAHHDDGAPCLSVPTTPLALIHKMLLKMLWRVSKARCLMAAPSPKGTHGLSSSAAPTKVRWKPWGAMPSLASSGPSTTRQAVDGGAEIPRSLVVVTACSFRRACRPPGRRQGERL